MRGRLVLIAGILLLLGTLPAAWAATGHLEGYIPVVARGAGLHGSFWTSDVWIYHQGAGVIHLWFNPSGLDGTSSESVVIEPEGPVVRLDDIVGTLFATEGLGSVHYLADGPVTVVSRTWTAAPGGGSYGQTIPGIPVAAASAAGSGQGGAMRMLVDQRAGARVNLGVVNVSPVAITAAVEIFTADGQPAPGSSSFTVDLAAFAMTQLNDILSRLPDGERSGLIIRVGVISAEGALLAYISEVDSTTNDASYQEGSKLSF